MPLSSSLLVLAAVLQGQAPANEFAHNFRGSNMPSPDRMALAGLDELVEATPEEGGLRIKVLANRGKDGVGVESKFPLTGDFEITASYEILSADKPSKGYGVGVNLTITPADWKIKRAALARYWKVQNRSGFLAMIKLTEPEPVDKDLWEPSETMKGQFRLRREGVNLLYLINEDLGQPFREIFQFAYGTDNIDAVRFVANPGNSPAAVDVRLLDVEMHWGGLPDHAATAPSLAVVNTDQGAEDRGLRPSHLAFVFLILFLLGLFTLYLVRQRKKGN